MLFKVGLTLALGLALNACAISELANKGKAKREKSEAEKNKSIELSEDANRPFLPLIGDKALPTTAEIWHPTDKSAIWTPKGDAIFYAGYGAVVNFDKKTLQFFTKEKSAARVFAPEQTMTEEVWSSWLEVFAQINRVEAPKPSRSCPSNVAEAQDSLTLQSPESRKIVLNYRLATCETDFTDTLSLERLFRWFEAHGANWVK